MKRNFKRFVLILVLILLFPLIVSCEKSNKPTDKEIFLSAKTATLDNSSAYEYTYSVDAGIKFVGAINFSPAKISGLVQWNENGGTTTYMQKRELSGALLFDSTTYIYNVGNELIELNADENRDFSIMKTKEIPSVFDFENNSIGILLNSLNDTCVGSVKKSEENNKFKIDFKTNFEEGTFLSALNHIDSSTIVNTINVAIKKKTPIEFKLDSYATLSDDESKIDSFNLSASIKILKIAEISLSHLSSPLQKLDKGQ